MSILLFQLSCLRKALLLLLLTSVGVSLFAQNGDSTLPGHEVIAIQHKYGLDPATPLLMRVGDAAAETIREFEEAGMSPRQHQLTLLEHNKIDSAFAALPPLHKLVLASHLRRISFLDDMPNTALTTTINPDDSFPLFDITFRAAILKQNLSEWITEKERSCFDTTGSALTVRIEAGTLDAIAYVLMHEATHVVDGYLGITPGLKTQNVPRNSFISGVWIGRVTIAPKFHSAWLDSSRFRHGKVIPIVFANTVYTALSRTPFVSLYSTSSWHEDLAEFVSVYDFTQVRKQLFRILLYSGNQQLFSYEPMHSALVRKRIRYIKRFYDKVNL